MSRPMMAQVSETTGSNRGATRQICRNRMVPGIALIPCERSLALLDKGPGGLLVVGSLAGARMVDRLAIEAGFQRQLLGIVDVAFDVAERDRRPLRQRLRKVARRRVDVGVGN